MRHHRRLLGLVILLTLPTWVLSDEPDRIALWGGRAPIDATHMEDADAWITVHPAARPNGTAIVICPGGGYGVLVKEPEGHGIAKWLNQHGITGVVLEYRLPAGRPEVPLLDAQRALRTVRAHSEGWHLKPDRIGIMGFSAGGHLASTAATRFDDGDPSNSDRIAQVSSRPDFAILIYPVITMGVGTHAGCLQNLLGKDPSPELMSRYSSERHVTAATPPTFLAHARDDRPVPPSHSRAFFAALQKAEVPAEYLELPSGGHGLDGYQGPQWDAWQTRVIEWVEEQQLAGGRGKQAKEAK